MYFILPDEGISPEELMADSEAVEFISNGGKTENAVGIKVHLAVPRFDVETRADLSEMLSALGLNSLFAPTGDYAILGDDALAYVSKIIHDARVAIDEEGCIAAAYTVIVTDATSAAPPESEVYFTVDRPFIFMITSSVGAPIFVGIVNNI